jgi:hypothetical protein
MLLYRTTDQRLHRTLTLDNKRFVQPAVFRDLDGAAHYVRHDELVHAQLPASALVGRAAVIVGSLLFLEQMIFSLQHQADALDAGGEESNDHSEMRVHCELLGAFTGLHHQIGGYLQQRWRPAKAPPWVGKGLQSLHRALLPRQRVHGVSAQVVCGGDETSH